MTKKNVDDGLEEILGAGTVSPFEDYERPKDVEPLVLKKVKDGLQLVYSPRNGAWFVDYNIQSTKECRVVGGVFTFSQEDVKDYASTDIRSRTFVLAKRDADDHEYFRLSGRILEIEHDVLFHEDLDVDLNWFSPIRVRSHLSIFQKVARLIDEEIVIGGSRENAIPRECWEKIVDQFPWETEVAHYIESRVENVLGEYLPTIKKGNELLQRYLVKLRNRMPRISRKSDWTDINSYEATKYEFLCHQLEAMLNDENHYESEWEQLVLQFVLLLFPQYIHVQRQLVIAEQMTHPGTSTKRRLDLTLFDAEGHLDVIEIKRPSAGPIFRAGQDHDNNIPSLALLKTVMQVEKYVLYLQKGGYGLETALNKSYPDLLPKGMKIKIVNPHGLILFGRSNKLTPDQKLDLEVLRRKYSHIADIITYDDLLERFKAILERFSVKASGHGIDLEG